MSDEFDHLKDKIQSARGNDNESAGPSQHAENVNVGARAGVELVGAVIGGALIGLGLDNWLGTKPLFLIVFLLLGVGAGFFNVYRITQNVQSVIGFSELHKREKQAKNAPDKKKQG